MSMWRWTARVVIFTLAIVGGGLALAQDGNGTLPRTADGRPDLQGVWDFRTLTPLQRPEDRGDQAVLTAEEAAEIEARAARSAIDADRPSEIRTEPLPVGPVGAYNNLVPHTNVCTIQPQQVGRAVGRGCGCARAS